jgi:hypothetical protein
MKVLKIGRIRATYTAQVRSYSDEVGIPTAVRDALNIKWSSWVKITIERIKND